MVDSTLKLKIIAQQECRDSLTCLAVILPLTINQYSVEVHVFVVCNLYCDFGEFHGPLTYTQIYGEVRYAP